LSSWRSPDDSGGDHDFKQIAKNAGKTILEQMRRAARRRLPTSVLMIWHIAKAMSVHWKMRSDERDVVAATIIAYEHELALPALRRVAIGRRNLEAVVRAMRRCG